MTDRQLSLAIEADAILDRAIEEGIHIVDASDPVVCAAVAVVDYLEEDDYAEIVRRRRAQRRERVCYPALFAVMGGSR